MLSINRLVLFVVFLVGGQGLFAHALWIETSTQGEMNKKHEVTIFYAEPNDKHEIITDWWSDTASFTLWLTLPNGKREQLTLQKGEDHFKSSFIPKVPGVYKLAINHNVAQLAGDTQYQFNASASVVVGTSKMKPDFTTNSAENGLFIQYKIQNNGGENPEVSILILDGEQPVAKNEVTVIAPSGWKKTLVTNDNGIATFDAEWRGDYIFEGFKTEEVTGRAFEKKVRIITLLAKIGS